ncbi:MAG: flippase-like domain-containing protein [Deltaproteobacteria bacterium]|nr:flippase-like domain-containing protein [Deltaproteobacteria bacterium]
MKNTIKKIFPWIVCLFIFYYLFSQIHPRELLVSLKFANVSLFVLFAVLYFFVVHILDCLTIKKFISRFSNPISHKECWLVRGVSYIIMIINYHAAQGAFAVYFKKTHGSSIAKTLGTLAFISIMDLILVLTCALVALLFSDVSFDGPDIRSFILGIAPLFYFGYFLWILFWRNVDKPYMNRIKKYKIAVWFLQHNMFLIFREALFKDYVTLFFYRAPMVLVVIGSYNLAITAFQAHIDWLMFYLYSPIIMSISTLPITPAGLGTGQFLVIAFFKNLIQSPLFAGLTTPESLLLASSLTWVLANQIIKAFFGTACLLMTSKKLFIDDSPVAPC